MSSPTAVNTVSQPTVRRAVYRQWDGRGQRARYVADKVFPELQVEEEKGFISRIPLEAETKDIDDARQSDGGYSRSEWEFDDFAYKTVERGHEAKIGAKENAAANFRFNSLVISGDIALSKVFRAHEIRAAAQAQNATATNYPEVAVSVKWDLPATATPIKDVLIAIQAIYIATGLRPNRIVIPRLAYDALRCTEEILDRLGTDNPDNPIIATRKAIAALLQIEEVIVADGLKDTADKGQTATLVDIWDKTKVFIGFIDDNPQETSTTAGWNAHWMGDGSQYDFRMERYFIEANRTHFIRARRQVKIQTVTAGCGFVLLDVL